MLTALPHVSLTDGERADGVLSPVAILPSARARFGGVCGALGALRALAGLLAVETGGRRSPILVVTEGTAEQ